VPRSSVPGIGALALTLLVLLASLGLVSALGAAHSVAPTSATPAPNALDPPATTGTRTAVAPTGPGPNWTEPLAPPAPLGMARPEGPTAALASDLVASGVPSRYAFLPNLDAGSDDLIQNGHIVPTYATVPAPMGLADLGLVNSSGTLSGTTLTTPRIAGTFAPTAFSGISPDSGAPDAYGVQVNAVLTNVTLFGNSSYQFWTQNVVEYSTYSHQLSFLDNVWNFSGRSGALSSNAILAHGENGTQVGTTFYYALGPVVTMGYPFTLSLFLNSGVTPSSDVVYFNYTLSNATETLSGSFDFVEFNSTGGTSPGTFPAPTYLADGIAYNPLGIPDDFEIDVVGPGGGSNFDALNASAALNLYYWSTTAQAFLVIPAAFDAGAETGETSTGLSSTWTTNGDLGLRGTAGPAAHLGQGPSLLNGEWGIAPSTEGIAVLHYALTPANGFTFVGLGLTPALAAYGWAPSASSYDLPPGNYSLWSLASEFSPEANHVALSTAGGALVVNLTADRSTGVYTPLWAFDSNALANISSECVPGVPVICTLDNNAYGPVGAPGPGAGSLPGGSFFPWFGAFNDFFFPVFPGIFLWNVSNVIVASPPTFGVSTPAWLVATATHFGTPSTNDLGLFFYDDDKVFLQNGAAIGGWWFEAAYFGPNAPQYSAVFWNTSSSTIAGNTFTTGGGALFLYGGEGNDVFNNTFLEYIPTAANAGSISGAVHGANGVFDADFSQGNFTGASCLDCDVLYNNEFGDYHPAYSPSVDPYTGLAPRLPFDDLWNLPAAQSGPNILGGPVLDGNYWWNFGTSNDPYWVTPYNASGAIAWGGDEAPIVPTPVWTISFSVSGLPSGLAWHLGVYTSTGVAFQATNGSVLSEPWPSGEFFFTANSLDGAYGIPSTGVFQVEGTNLTVPITFYPLFSLTFTTTNFPAGAFWAITLSNPTFGGFLDLGNVAQFPAEILAASVYNYTISPPAGYSVYPPDGSINLTQNSTILLAFSEEGAPGTLSVTLSPAGGAQVWVDGTSVPTASEGSFSLTLPAGLHSVRATEPGYVPYDNNVTIQGGGVTSLAIDFVAIPGTCACTSVSAAPDLPWVLAGAFAGVAVAMALALWYVIARRRPPTPPPTGVGASPKP
jgi:thermopsin